MTAIVLASGDDVIVTLAIIRHTGAEGRRAPHHFPST